MFLQIVPLLTFVAIVVAVIIVHCLRIAVLDELEEARRRRNPNIQPLDEDAIPIPVRWL
jgi:hypothetical protein